ncbi:MAG TPA: alkaline phosphatase family protein [Thermoleophilaceae bacterium]|nr:alkaline phosphatase family protein [Thermoleophilaceae bacterium]
MRRGALAAAMAAAALLVLAATATAAPPIKHVFVVILENEDADSTFGVNSKAPYLSKTLRARGGFVPGFYATGHLSLDNYISMVSGQGPNPYTQADAPAYIDFAPGLPGPDGQYLGQGSVYPPQVRTISDQLDDNALTWRGFMEDMANGKNGEPKTCRHPAVGSADDTQMAEPGDQYAMRHNPFMYFHSIIDDQAHCDASVVPLSRLKGDLESVSTTPNYSFITPNLCHDGHDEPCVDGQPGGMVSANRFLQSWIPRILRSPAYRQDGLVIITFDEAESHDADACCGEKQGPNTPNNGGPTPGAGGGRIGAVLLSRFIKPGTVSKQEYNHYSMLRSTEDLFGLGHLGYAGAAGLRPFGADLFTNPSGVQRPPVKPPALTLALTKPPGCARRPFGANVAVNGAGIHTVVKRDSRVLRRTGLRSFSVRINVRKLKAGRHTVRATATDRFGRRVQRTRAFSRCAHP